MGQGGEGIGVRGPTERAVSGFLQGAGGYGTSGSPWNLATGMGSEEVAQGSMMEASPRISTPKEGPMAGRRLAAVILIVAGVLGLIYGSFSYTKETHEAKIGPLQFSIKEKETINIPMWAGIAAIGAGVIVLLVGGGKR